MTNARPVWLTQEQRDDLEADGRGNHLEIVAAWDATPSDSVDAVLTAINQGYAADADEAAAILRALGAP